MKIDYEAHKVYDPDYLNEHLGFVSGILELLENFDDESPYEKSHIKWVLQEANGRVRDILEKLHESVAMAAKDMKEKTIQEIGKKAK